jgi:AmmeMemoRadiSam system protein A
MISSADEKSLLSLARQALEARVAGDRPPQVVCIGPLALRCGAFVSIHNGDQLRGCLGRLSPSSSLGTTLVYLGAALADSDPRFPPVLPDELPLLQMEISLLTPERAVASIDEITVGQHGVIVEHGRSRGLLLPQVAPEFGWDRETFLEQACLKAGLPRDAWRTGARILMFEARIFAESAPAATS